ncbi:uncharacterized protein [Nicotiana sylvestris]|uniref:uncharacterized protein n=1 Tax=Nicotiana sylvestris TaxID=4096 RepID=UPI00388C8652
MRAKEKLKLQFQIFLMNLPLSLYPQPHQIEISIKGSTLTPGNLTLFLTNIARNLDTQWRNATDYMVFLRISSLPKVSPSAGSDNLHVEESGFAHFPGLFTAYAVESTDFHGPSLKRTLVIGKAAGRLYYLHPDAELFLSQHISSVLSNSVSCNKSDFLSIPSFICSICPMVRQQRLPFYDSHIHSTAPFQLVHIDVWGPYNTRTYNGFRYFLTLVDDYGRATWTHLLSCKGNALSVLKAFTSTVKTHFQSSVQTFRSDNAYELGSSSEAAAFFSNQATPSATHPSTFPSFMDIDTSPTSAPTAATEMTTTSDVSSHPIGEPNIPTTPSALPLPSPSISYSTPTPPCVLQPSPLPPPAPTLRKSSITIIQPSYLQDYVCNSVLPLTPISAISKVSHFELHVHEPQHYQQATSHPAWQEAILKEFQALESNQTWGIVPLPSHKKVIPSLHSRGYISSLNDYSLLTKSSSDSLVILDSQFKIKDLGLVHYFLSLEISQHPQGYLMNQQKYTTDLLQEFNCHHFSPVSTPLDSSLKLTVDMSAPVSDPSVYRRLIGKLNFLQHKRPDISFYVQHLIQFLQKPQVPHMMAAIYVLRYLLNDPAQGILLSSSDNLSLVGFSDSAWGSCAISRKSVSGFYISLGGSPVSWKSKKPPTISLSSTEAEYRALRKLAAEVAWLVRLLVDLGLAISYLVHVYCDSQAALHIAKNPIFYERTKHIEIDCHYVRECITVGLLTLHFVSSSGQLANIMTKALPTQLHYGILGKLGVSSPSSLGGGCGDKIKNVKNKSFIYLHSYIFACTCSSGLDTVETELEVPNIFVDIKLSNCYTTLIMILLSVEGKLKSSKKLKKFEG